MIKTMLFITSCFYIGVTDVDEYSPVTCIQVRDSTAIDVKCLGTTGIRKLNSEVQSHEHCLSLRRENQ